MLTVTNVKMKHAVINAFEPFSYVIQQKGKDLITIDKRVGMTDIQIDYQVDTQHAYVTITQVSSSHDALPRLTLDCRITSLTRAGQLQRDVWRLYKGFIKYYEPHKFKEEGKGND